MKKLAAALIFVLCSTAAAQADCRGGVVRLYLRVDGTVSWNKETLMGPRDMVERFQREAKSVMQPKILFIPEPGVEPATGLSIVSQAQNAGLECVEFSGYGTRPSR